MRGNSWVVTRIHVNINYWLQRFNGKYSENHDKALC